MRCRGDRDDQENPALQHLHSAMQEQTTLVLASLSLAFVCLASGTSDVATGTALMEMKRDNAELKRDNTELKKHFTELKKHFAEVEKHYIDVKNKNTELNNEIADLRHEIRGVLSRQSMTSGQSTSGGGATYIRWGRTSCPAESILVYKGFVSGSLYNHTGAATNHVCLPEDPQYNTAVLPIRFAEMYGAEYETFHFIFRSDFQDQDIPCAVCRSPTRSSAIMIPARTSCYPGLHREYYGYLMAGWPGHNVGSEYICVDGDPETVHGGGMQLNVNVLFFTVSRCEALKCPPYVEKRVLSCVVCSQ